jgi:hypothetical protein
MLHDHTWFGHVVKGHPDVRRERTSALEAISKPLEIRYSTSDVNCRLYYGASLVPGIMIVVVADVVAGYVKTVYRAKKMKGDVEWS